MSNQINTAPDAQAVSELSWEGMSLVESNNNWFAAAGQMPFAPTPSSRQAAFYMGMQCEELAEKLTAVFGDGSKIVGDLEQLGILLKGGEHDLAVADAMSDPARVKEMLDGDIDLLWVSVGAARAMGSDVPGAYGEVDRTNWGKRFPDGTFHLSPVGKVLKPEGWTKPDLTPFIHEDLRG